jgi:hypothetical protein
VRRGLTRTACQPLPFCPTSSGLPAACAVHLVTSTTTFSPLDLKAGRRGCRGSDRQEKEVHSAEEDDKSCLSAVSPPSADTFWTAAFAARFVTPTNTLDSGN